MARIQILELPEGADDERPPFVLVVDQVHPEEVERIRDGVSGMRDDLGARAVLAFEAVTIDIPANEVTVDENGHPVRLRVTPDFTDWWPQIDAVAAETIRRLNTATGRQSPPNRQFLYTRTDGPTDRRMPPMADLPKGPGFVAFEIAGEGAVPAPNFALRHGRVLAERHGYTVPDDAEPVIRQAVDGSDSYKVEVPLTH